MLYPYKFVPSLVERVWGGNALRRYGKAVPEGKRIGESWEISDRDDVQSVVANGPDQGKTLREQVKLLGAKLLGTNCGKARRFPLLVKLIDARERLSLQVHPPAAAARKLGGEPKTEMWYVLEADSDAHLIAGLRRGMTREKFVKALEQASSPIAHHPSPVTSHQSPVSLEDCIYRFPVARGDAFFVPSGRMHAIDAGVVLVEIQQSSDTTYRVYDWGRVGLDGRPRELHVKESLACINFHDIEPELQSSKEQVRGINGWRRLIECEHFHVHQLDMPDIWPDQCDGTTFHIVTCVDGALSVLSRDGKTERINVGEFVLLPAALGHYTLKPLATTTRALKAYVPPPASSRRQS
ncbi:MAG TPA: type I phosphomannose isomerase catalytic subunit [Verrucomicrobiae bacterium]|nr:type I phosphomannose isomerase catalytic subunit [Verrucomicrobiae bacterium]